MKFFLLTILFFSFNTKASTSISILHGDTFRDDLGYKKSQEIFTIENFSLWEYGSVFFYYDIANPTGNDQGGEYYSSQFFGSIAPTFSLSKILKKNFKYGIIEDVSLHLEMENGSGSGYAAFRNYFYGPEFLLKVPYFDFVSFALLLRDNPEVAGQGVQLNLAWSKTMDYGPSKKFKFVGFVATSPWDGNNNDNDGIGLDKWGRYLTAQPQFLYDLGYALGRLPNTLETGFEFAYYINRYQFKGKYESVLQYMVKFTY